MNNFFSLQPNTTYYKIDYAGAFAKTVNKDSGVYRLAKLAENILIIVKEILIYIGKMLYVPQLTKAVSHFNSACKALLLNKLFSSAVDFKKTFNASDRLSQKLVYETLELAGDLCTASGYFGAIGLAKAAKFTGLINKTIDTKKHLGRVIENDSAKAKSFDAKCNFRKYVSVLSLGLIKHPLMTQEHPADVRKVAMIRLAKDITALALAVVSVIAFIFGVHLLSKMTILVISTISIICALSASVAGEMTSHKVALLNAKRM